MTGWVIAMWSGPRSLSTALMYSFAQRTDTAVVDEPFYAAYLARTGADHPMGAEIMASQPQDPRQVADVCATPPGAGLIYQKHMVQHMGAGVPLDWMAQVTNVFLIRHPARIIASFTAKRHAPAPEELGVLATGRLFDHARALGQEPVIVAAEDIRAAPEATLRALCAALAIPFDPAMLSWKAGPRPEDGIWAPVWYGAIHRSTGFSAAEGPLPALPAAMVPVLDAALPIWERLNALRIRP